MSWKHAVEKNRERWVRIGKTNGEQNAASGHWGRIQPLGASLGGRATAAIPGQMARMGKVGGSKVPRETRARASKAAWAKSPEPRRAALRLASKLGGQATAAIPGQMASLNAKQPREAKVLGNQNQPREAKQLGGRVTAAHRWGYEAEPGLWLSRKTGKVLLDQRTEKAS